MKPKVKFKWWYCVLYGMAMIIDGVTIIVTLGFYPTNLSLKLALLAVSKNIYRK